MSSGLASNHNPNKSIEVAQPPTDSISSLSFSPVGNYLVATSWDNQVRCWEIQRSGTSTGSVPKASISHDQPVLCSAWKDDGMTVFSGGCDKQVKMWPLMSGGQPVTVAMHDAPIKELAWIPQMSLLVTGSWDKTLKYWDTRQSNPVHTQQLPERCYALTVRHPLMVVGTADRNLIVFNLQNPQAEFKRITSPLKYQTRCVEAFPDQQGFLIGSIEGRVGVHHLDDAQQSKNFTFKCHREGNDIYSVNSLNFHPVRVFRLEFIIHLQQLDLMVLLIFGTRIANKDSRPCNAVVNQYRAAHSTVMVQYLRMRFLMTGVRVQKITILQLQRVTFSSIYRRSQRLKGSQGLERPIESEVLVVALFGVLKSKGLEGSCVAVC